MLYWRVSPSLVRKMVIKHPAGRACLHGGALPASKPPLVTNNKGVRRISLAFCSASRRRTIRRLSSFHAAMPISRQC